jgi:adenylate cyclase
MERTVAILMADLAGYTAMTEIHGGKSAEKLVSRYLELVDLSLHGAAEVVQRIGDQVVILATNSIDLAFTAADLIRGAHGTHQFLSIHAALHFGCIQHEGANIFGSPVNVASRVMNLAESGKILCSSAFVNSVADKNLFQFISIGPVRFKNIIQEIEIFEMVVEMTSAVKFHTDPVCHMVLQPGKDNHAITFEGTEYHFCSVHCREVFLASPSNFLH